MGYVDFGYKPSKDDLVCLFRIEPNHEERVPYRKAAEMVAGESSTGTWTELKTMNKKVRNMGAKVFEMRGNWFKIAYPSKLFEEGNMPQILSSVAGNIFGMKAISKLRLEDIKWPEKIMKSFKGPKFGIPGVRKILKVSNRPLVGTIVKPKIGLTPKQHAKVAYESWVGGCDIVKDDENLTDQNFNRFEERVKETLKMRDRAERETGDKKAYMPNVTGETKEMIKRARFVRKQDGRYMMVDIVTTGWAGLQTLRNQNINLVMHAHRAGHAAFTRGNHGISMLVVADIARLIGVDQIHVGTAVGKMVGGKEEVKHVGEEIEERIIREGHHSLEENWGEIKPVFAVCSGGLQPGLVPRLVEIMGSNIIIQAGGGIHGHPNGTKSGARAMRQALNSAMEGIPIEEYAKKHKELKIAIRKWGKI